MILIKNALGGRLIQDGGYIIAHDAYTDKTARLPFEAASRLLLAFDRQWPRADYLDRIRHLIANA